MPLSERQLTEVQELLENEREGLVKQVKATTGHASVSHGDSGDLSSSEWDTELVWELEDHEREHLIEVDEACKRISRGTYGVCEMCGKEIPFARLKAMPTARYTVECQEVLDREKRNRG